MAIFSTLGKLAQIGGAGLSMAGLPMVGVPLSVAGGVTSGASQGGVKGGVAGGVTAGVQQAVGGGVNKALEGLKTPVDMGASTGYSQEGNPLTIPGVRKNSIQTYNAQGSPTMTPASPTEFMGGS
jgi:hypothetical protein